MSSSPILQRVKLKPRLGVRNRVRLDRRWVVHKSKMQVSGCPGSRLLRYPTPPSHGSGHVGSPTAHHHSSPQPILWGRGQEDKGVTPPNSLTPHFSHQHVLGSQSTIAQAAPYEEEQSFIREAFLVCFVYCYIHGASNNARRKIGAA